LTIDKAAVFLDYREFIENSTYVSLSRVRNLNDLIILDTEIINSMFKNLSFFRGFKNQSREYKRLEIEKFAFGGSVDLDT
jgi:hypothetical protein